MTWSTGAIEVLLAELFPLCRSITGEGTRATLRRLGEIVPLTLTEVPSGTRVFDWTVPPEWSIREAWIKDADGRKLVDFSACNLHLASYSIPFHGMLEFAELDPHLLSLPDQPDAIPYRTHYYQRQWSFCVSERLRQSLDPQGRYEVLIDSHLDDRGSLTYASALHRGRSTREILISSYCCHPSLANDNLSGLVLAVLLFDAVRRRDTFYSYRLVLVPETIGAIAYLAQHQEEMAEVLCGLLPTTVAGPGMLALKRSWRGDDVVDRLAVHALQETGQAWADHPFDPHGSDERQYSSPGFRIPVVTIARSKYYDYPEYHTSLDDLTFISAGRLAQTLEIYRRLVDLIEMVRVYERTEPHCEYQLGRHGLYPAVGGSQRTSGAATAEQELNAMLWLGFGCDGTADLLTLSERSNLPLSALHDAAGKMLDKAMLLPARPWR